MRKKLPTITIPRVQCPSCAGLKTFVHCHRVDKNLTRRDYVECSDCSKRFNVEHVLEPQQIERCEE